MTRTEPSPGRVFWHWMHSTTGMPKSEWSIVGPGFDGAALAVVIYFLCRSLLLVLGLEVGEVNPWGFLAIAGIAGMFSHKAGDGLRERFGRLFTDPPANGGTAAQ